MKNTIQNMGHQISAMAGSFVYARTQSAVRVRAGVVFALAGTVFIASSMGIAEAGQDFNQYATAVSGKTNKATEVINYVCYIGGAAMGALGVVELKKHVENPGQVELKKPLIKLFVGGLLLAFPSIAAVMTGTTEGTGKVNTTNFGTAPTI